MTLLQIIFLFISFALTLHFMLSLVFLHAKMIKYPELKIGKSYYVDIFIVSLFWVVFIMHTVGVK